jgi:hypothetical protein
VSGSDVLVMVAVIGGVVALQRWVLPWLGVPT